MPDDTFELSRRKALAGLGTIGVASAGAGMGTSAFFSDTESFEGNTLVAGELDLKIDWQEHYSDWSPDEDDDVEENSSDDVLSPAEDTTSYNAADDGDDNDADGAGEFNVVMIDQFAPDGTELSDADVKAQVPEGYTGLNDPQRPLLAVPDPWVDDFMYTTRVEAFPDSDDDGWQDDIVEPCGPGSNLGDTPEARSSDLRTNTNDAGGTIGGQETTPGDPLINIDDVKPGDMGEATLSFHLCDNPGFVWLQGELVDADENGQNEPELADDDEVTAGEYDADPSYDPDDDGVDETLFPNEGDETDDTDDSTTVPEPVELLDAMRAILWCDADGDNVFDENESLIARGSLREILRVLSQPDADIPNSPVPGLRLDPACYNVGQVLDDEVDDNGNFQDIICEVLGKVEYDDESGLFNADSPNVVSITQFDTWDDGDTAEFTFEIDFDGDNTPDTELTIQLEDTVFKSGTRELIEFDVRLVGVTSTLGTTPDLGLCQLDVKSGGGPDPENIDGIGCVDLIENVKTKEVGAGNPSSLSFLQFYYCEEPDDGNGGIVETPVENCFPNSTTFHVGLAWYLPVDHANEIQTDSVSFDIGFYTEQCRHNDGTGQAPETT